MTICRVDFFEVCLCVFCLKFMFFFRFNQHWMSNFTETEIFSFWRNFHWLSFASSLSMGNIHTKLSLSHIWLHIFNRHVVIWSVVQGSQCCKHDILYIYYRWPLDMSNVGANRRAHRGSWHYSICPFPEHGEQDLDWLHTLDVATKLV